nr:F-box domain [Pandoravirus massiliensis]
MHKQPRHKDSRAGRKQKRKSAKRRRQASVPNCSSSTDACVDMVQDGERSRPSLMDLPDELLLGIMEHGGPGTVGRLACTCRRLSVLGLDDCLWKGLCVLKDDPDMDGFVPQPDRGWRWIYRAHIFRPCPTPDLVLGSSWYGGAAITYAGEWANGIPNGYGRFTHCSDLGLFTCQGHWRNAREHGYCVRQHEYRETCRGEFRHGKMHGTVRFTNAHGSVYEGEARRGKKHGTGTLWYTDGGHYSGQFRRDERCGHGTLTWPDGTTVTGQWMGDAIVPETAVHGRAPPV